MRKIGFIGAFDKTDLISYVAKILVDAGKKVLLVDTTITQRARYIIPTITPSKYYITSYEDVDVAVGFDDLEGIKNYQGTEVLDYDIVIIDIDSNEMFTRFNMDKADRNYFVTAFDSYSLKKGLEVIGKIQDKIIMTKVLFSRDMLQEEDDYLNFLSFYYGVAWEKNKIYFPYEQGDATAIIENQRAAKIRFKNLTLEYKTSLEELAGHVCPDIKMSLIRKITKTI